MADAAEADEDVDAGAQERAVFLLDVRPELFVCDGTKATRAEVAVRQVLDFVKGRLLDKSKDLVALVACGDGAGGTDGVTVLSLGMPTAKGARTLSKALEDGHLKTAAACAAWLKDGLAADAARTASHQGQLKNGLERCAREFEDYKKAPNALDAVYVFSAAEAPCDAGEADVCETWARDSADVDREVQLYHFPRAPFDLDRFWRARILEASAAPADAPGAWQDRAHPASADADVFEASRARAAARGGFRGGEKVTVTLGFAADAPHKVLARLSPLFKAKNPPAKVRVDRATMQRVTAETGFLDKSTGAKLDRATDVVTYVPVGPLGLDDDDDPERRARAKAHRAYVDAADRNDCADGGENGFADADVALLGFCAREDAFPGGYELRAGSRGPCLLAPDDGAAPGSGAIVAALRDVLESSGKVGIGRYSRRPTMTRSAPRLVALAPRAEGLCLVELPFGDEVRAPPRATPAARDAALDEEMGSLVDALSARCERGGPVDVVAGIPNCRLRAQQAALEAHAFELDASGVDRAWAAADAQKPEATPEVDAILDRLREVLPEDVAPEKPAAKRRKVDSTPVLVPPELLAAPVDRAALKKFTNDALKAVCANLGVTKSGTKDALVERIANKIEEGG